MTTRILHVDLDAFFVEVCRQRHPELRDVDLLVVGGRRDQRGVVQSASYGARRYGVHSGMPIARAVRLCPDATFFQGDFSHYRTASKAVRQVLLRHSPVVVMASLDEAYLDFTGTDRLYPRSLLPVAEQIRDEVKEETGLDCSIGVGPNRMIAKIASELAKPRGLLEVRSGWEEGFMAGLPLRAIPGIGPKTAARLTSLGLTDVIQIQQLDQTDLERLVPPDQARLLKLRAHGYGGVGLRSRRQPKSISRETTLSTDVKDRAGLETTLERLTARVASELRHDALMARTVTLKLRHGDFRTITRQRTLTVPTDLDPEIWEAVRGLFRAAFSEVKRRGKGVRLIGVAATNLVPSAPADLFEAPDRERLRKLTTAVDRARAKYGFNAVTPGSLLGSQRRSARPAEPSDDHATKGATESEPGDPPAN
ncbi:MAG: DNA polymerase IV [Gemmatimonadales bacterium]|nr:DNA polymerase IV [Gemmatimonadales bacterium]